MKVMTKEQKQAKVDKEREIIKKYKHNKELLKNKLIKLHYNLPEIVIQQFLKNINKNNDLYNDLYQAGLYGMLIAFDKFDFNKNTLFSSYAFFYIRKYVYEELRKANIIKIPQHHINNENNTFCIDNISSKLIHIDEKDEVEYTYKIKHKELNEYISKNKIKIMVTVEYYLNGNSMQYICDYYGLKISEVKKILKGYRDPKTKVLKIKPFIEEFKTFLIQNNINLNNKYIEFFKNYAYYE